MENIQQYCRLCGEQKPVKSLIDISKNAKVYNDVCVKLHFINVDYVCLDEEALPKTICHFCHQALNRTHGFLTSVKRVQPLLRMIFSGRYEVKKESSTEAETNSQASTLNSTLNNPRMVAYTDAGSALKEIISRTHPPKDTASITSNQRLESEKDSQASVDNINREPGKIVHVTEKKVCTKNKNCTGYKWLCQHCGLYFGSVWMLRCHRLAEHNIEFKVFVQHVREHHPSLKLSCEYCNYTFAGDEEARAQHRKQRTTGNMCKYCTKEFRTVVLLTQHLASFEGNYRPILQKQARSQPEGAKTQPQIQLRGAKIQPFVPLHCVKNKPIQKSHETSTAVNDRVEPSPHTCNIQTTSELLVEMKVERTENDEIDENDNVQQTENVNGAEPGTSMCFEKGTPVLPKEEIDLEPPENEENDLEFIKTTIQTAPGLPEEMEMEVTENEHNNLGMLDKNDNVQLPENVSRAEPGTSMCFDNDTPEVPQEEIDFEPPENEENDLEFTEATIQSAPEVPEEMETELTENEPNNLGMLDKNDNVQLPENISNTLMCSEEFEFEPDNISLELPFSYQPPENQTVNNMAAYKEPTVSVHHNQPSSSVMTDLPLLEEDQDPMIVETPVLESDLVQAVVVDDRSREKTVESQANHLDKTPMETVIQPDTLQLPIKRPGQLKRREDDYQPPENQTVNKMTAYKEPTVSVHQNQPSSSVMTDLPLLEEDQDAMIVGTPVLESDLVQAVVVDDRSREKTVVSQANRLVKTPMETVIQPETLQLPSKKPSQLEKRKDDAIIPAPIEPKRQANEKPVSIFEIQQSYIMRNRTRILEKLKSFLKGRSQTIEKLLQSPSNILSFTIKLSLWRLSLSLVILLEKAALNPDQNDSNEALKCLVENGMIPPEIQLDNAIGGNQTADILLELIDIKVVSITEVKAIYGVKQPAEKPIVPIQLQPKALVPKQLEDPKLASVEVRSITAETKKKNVRKYGRVVRPKRKQQDKKSKKTIPKLKNQKQSADKDPTMLNEIQSTGQNQTLQNEPSISSQGAENQPEIFQGAKTSNPEMDLQCALQCEDAPKQDATYQPSLQGIETQNKGEPSQGDKIEPEVHSEGATKKRKASSEDATNKPKRAANESMVRPRHHRAPRNKRHSKTNQKNRRQQMKTMC